MAQTKILNLDNFIQKLDRLSEADFNETLNKACLLVENDAKLKCPVDTGQLRSSITHRIEGTTGIVGTNVEYAPYVEYGTGKHARNGNGRQTPWAYKDPKTGELIWTAGSRAANGGIGFLEPALLENEQAIIKLFKKTLKEVK